MNPNDVSPEPAHDAELAAALQGLPLPAAPSDLRQRVRDRLRSHFAQQRSIAGLRAAAVVLVLVTIFQVCLHSVNPVAAKPELSAAELNFLFGPPPVDPLVVLDRQQQVAYRTMQRWEPNR